MIDDSKQDAVIKKEREKKRQGAIRAHKESLAPVLAELHKAGYKFDSLEAPMRPNFARLTYLRDKILAFFLVFSILGTVGHLIDYLRDGRADQLRTSVGFVLAGAVCILLSPNRVVLVIAALFGIVLIGTVGAILHRSLWGLPIIIPSAVLGVLLIAFKGRKLQ